MKQFYIGQISFFSQVKSYFKDYLLDNCYHKGKILSRSL